MKISKVSGNLFVIVSSPLLLGDVIDSVTSAIVALLSTGIVSYIPIMLSVSSY
jgi:hypothetical protein